MISVLEKENIKEVVMSILADYHMHSKFSTDGKAVLAEMIEGALSKGLKKICFTEHMDHGYPISEQFPEGSWELNVDSYLYDLLKLREQYRDRIDIGFGIEIGMQESVFKENTITAKSHEFDFIIGSIHLVDGVDIYEPRYFEDKTPHEGIEKYFKTILANIKKFQNYDVLGHIDYVVRKVPGGESVYNTLDYKDLIDEILNCVIDNEKGIEINTAALNKGFSNPNPHRDIVKRYRELGGEFITIGSDAHKPEDIAGHFDIAEQILREAGFDYYNTYENRVAFYNKLK